MSLHDVEYPDEKVAPEHLELDGVKRDEEIIVDTEVKGYTDSSVVIDAATNKRLLKLINKRYVGRPTFVLMGRVLPCMLMCYFAQALDKGCLGTASLQSARIVRWADQQASIMGLQADTGMVGQD